MLLLLFRSAPAVSSAPLSAPLGIDVSGQQVTVRPVVGTAIGVGGSEGGIRVVR